MNKTYISIIFRSKHKEFRSCTEFYIFSKKKFLLAGDKLSPCQQHCLNRPGGNIIHNNSQHIKCIGVGVFCDFTDTSGWVDGKPHVTMADVLAIELFW